MSETDAQQTVDVERLVEELKERVARDRVAGKYDDDVSDVALEVLPPSQSTDAVLAESFDLATGGTRVRFRPELGFSSKPVVGPVLTLVKKVLLRLLFFVLDDLAHQADAAVQRLETALAAEVAAREAAVSAEAKVREGAQADVVALSLRADRFESRVDGLAIAERLARLERDRRARPAPAVSPAPPTVAADASATAGAASFSDFDYLAFEARFRPEESVRERQKVYIELLRNSNRVVDLGCGRGELLGLLRAEGVSAYGVEIEPDFIGLLEDTGIEVVAEDAVAHLAGLETGAVDGIVASHLVEHLPSAAVTQLVGLAAEKLAKDGLLIVETPNPESLVAGSVNFHRDLSHLRPIHPDTLAFLCESVGFAEVDIRRLSPVPDAHRLPVPVGEVGSVVRQLNDLLYGYQDYAVVARK
jgi:SAM-dependent methyltransferase